MELTVRRLTFFLVLVSGALSYEIVTPPPDQTGAGVGADVVIPCGVRDTSASNFIEWKEYVDTAIQGTRIWLSPPNTDGVTHPNSTKYEVTGRFNLNIKSISIYDGGKYTCGLLIEDIVHEAHLMVLARPSCSSSTDVHEGEEMEVFCMAEFGGEQKPEVVMDKDSQRLETTISDDQIYSRTVRHNFTANWNDDGKETICFSRTANPSMSENCSMTLEVKHSVREMEISPDTEIHYVGEQVNCTVSGNPLPEVTWERASGGGLIRSPILPITSDMMTQPQHWICRAQNTVRNQVHRASHHHNFTVSSATTGPPTNIAPSSSSSRIFLFLSTVFILLSRASSI